MADLPTFPASMPPPQELREQFWDYLVGRMFAHIQPIHARGADTRFISVLLENPDLSPEDLGMGMNEDERDSARRMWVVGK